jgi:putative hydroxymethylpyrimidine transporter CytX
MKSGQIALIWIGASISISEIVAGSFFGGMDPGEALCAIIGGHLAGALFIAAAGHISWKQQKNAMEAVAFSFGERGGKGIAFCNVVQLIGWTVIMVVQAANALAGLYSGISTSVLILLLAILTVAWAFIFKTPAGILNSISVVLLACLCAAMFLENSFGAPAGAPGETLRNGMPFVAAFELSMSMPVSWLPLVGDYSRDARGRTASSLVPGAAYFAGSSLMYLFGYRIAEATGGDFFAFLAASNFRGVACAVVILSTLTTAFLDLYSASVSAKTIIRLKGEGTPLVCSGLVVIILSAFFPVAQFERVLENFLYAIGSVFVPVYAVLILNFLFPSRFFPGRKGAALLCAAGGIAAYHCVSRLGWGAPVIAGGGIPCVLYTAFCLGGLWLFRRKNAGPGVRGA